MKPIPVIAILNLINAGYPIDLILRLSINSINGVNNSYGGIEEQRLADPRFYPLMEKMVRSQRSRAIGMKTETKGAETKVLFLFREVARPEIQKDISDIREILNLNSDSPKFTIVAGSVPKDGTEIAVLTRSLAEILVDLSSDIQVPTIHVAERRTSPTRLETREDGTPVAPLIRIQSSKQEPSDAFVSVSYRGYWFWIDDKDLPSKARFSFLRPVFALTETGADQGGPIVTIPAG
jgi:hypothetical protein